MKQVVFFLLSIVTLPCMLSAQPFSRGFIQNKHVVQDAYLPSTVIVKLKAGTTKSAAPTGIEDKRIQEVFKELGVSAVRRKFPNHQPPANQYNRYGQPMADISGIYELQYTAPIPLTTAIARLLQTGLLAYAEPHFIPQFLYTPNDPSTGKQYHLATIKAYEAWDINKGDTNIVIGITDTGTDLDHPDLVNNVKYNYYDPIDGFDNDNDGFIDNFRGWDMGSDDNDPEVGPTAHGIHVAGIAAASTDNGTGIAGTGFRCKHLPVRVDNQNGSLTMGYEAIVYCADHGCSVINCSWGGTSGAGQFGQDIIDYATINKDVLVVAAAGNNNNNRPLFPAAYNHVLNVTGTDVNDVKWESSTYGISVDIAAPGKDIHSTWAGGTYLTSSGTSMACPLVAGMAGVIRSEFPSYSAMQVIEQIRVTADHIDTIAGNSKYKGLLGAGRVNFYNALTVKNRPSVRIDEDLFHPEIYQGKEPNDLINMVLTFRNFLNPSNNLIITLTSESPYATLLDDQVSFIQIGTMDTASNYLDPFVIRLSPYLPPNHELIFTVEYDDGAYHATESFSIMVNINYVDLDTNKISTSITGLGTIGFADISYAYGTGFHYDNGANISSWAGLVLGVSTAKVSDNVYGVSNDTDEDFITTIRVEKSDTARFADAVIYAQFNDSGAGVNALNVTVDHYAYAWADPKDEDYIIAEYRIINTDTVTILNLYAGFYMDYDIWVNTENKAAWDETNNMAYVHRITGTDYGAVKLLSDTKANCYLFDNDGGNGSISIYDGFTNYDKFVSMTSQRKVAGAALDGGDVSIMLSAGPYNLKAGDTVTVAWALIAGYDLLSLQESAQAAQERYTPRDTSDSVFGIRKARVPEVRVFPMPADEAVYIEVSNMPATTLEVRLLDAWGRPVVNTQQEAQQTSHQVVKINTGGLSAGLYIVELRVGENVEKRKIILE